MVLKNKDTKRTIWIWEWNSQENFEYIANSKRQLLENKFRKAGFEISEDKFSFDQMNGSKIGLQILRAQNTALTLNITSRIWAEELKQEQIILHCVAIGENVETANDQEILSIISSVTIK